MASKDGGSRSTVLSRVRKKGPSRQDTARLRAIEILGVEVVEKMRRDWDSWDTKPFGKEWQQSEGVVIQLIQQGLSSIVIRAIVPVGGSRIDRLRKVLQNGVDTLHTRRERQPAAHAFLECDLSSFKAHCKTWELEDGFPCAHRRPRQYLTEPKITWKELHARYVYEMERLIPPVRALSYSRFTQYVHLHYPGVRLTRTAEDVCDCCVRLEVQLRRDDLPEEEMASLRMEKSMHLTAAIEQRRFVSSFVKSYIALHAPDQSVPTTIIPDEFDDEQAVDEQEVITSVPTTDPESESVAVRNCIVQIQAEDFGGGIAMPHYGYSRPSADYFNSNLIIQNFVVADITNSINNVYFYDERAQGK